MKRDDLIKTAEGIMEVIPCDPAIPTDEDIEDEDILNGIKEAAELIEDTDVESFDEEVIENLKKLKCWNPIVTKAKKITKKVVEEEPEPEPEEEEEKAPAKKTAGKTQPIPAKKEKAAPAKKEKVVKEKKEKTVSRGIIVVKAMQSIKGKQTIDQIAEIADDNYVSSGGTSNVKQTKNIINVLLTAAKEWGIVVEKDGKLSNS